MPVSTKAARPLVLDDVRGRGPGANILGVDCGDAVGVTCEAGLQSRVHGRIFPALLACAGARWAMGCPPRWARRTVPGRGGLTSMLHFRRRSCSIGWRATLAGRNLQLLHRAKIGCTIAKSRAVFSPAAMRIALIHSALAASLLAGFCGVAARARRSRRTCRPPCTRSAAISFSRAFRALDPALAARLERYLHARQASFLDWLPDGGMLIATRFGEVDQIHRLAAPLGVREQLTFSPDPVSAARAPQTPGAEGFVFLKDHGGDENAQVYFYRLADHSTRLLTDGKSLHGSVVWSHDGKRMAFYGNERDGVSFDVYVADVAARRAPRLVVGGHDDTWYPARLVPRR